MRTFKNLDKLKTTVCLTESEKKKIADDKEKKENEQMMIDYKKEKDAQSKKSYKLHRRMQSMILGMEDKIGSHFFDMSASPKFRDAGRSARTILNE